MAGTLTLLSLWFWRLTRPLPRELARLAVLGTGRWRRARSDRRARLLDAAYRPVARDDGLIVATEGPEADVITEIGAGHLASAAPDPVLHPGLDPVPVGVAAPAPAAPQPAATAAASAGGAPGSPVWLEPIPVAPRAVRPVPFVGAGDVRRALGAPVEPPRPLSGTGAAAPASVPRPARVLGIEVPDADEPIPDLFADDAPPGSGPRE